MRRSEEECGVRRSEEAEQLVGLLHGVIREDQSLRKLQVECAL